MILANITMSQHVITQALRRPETSTMTQHDPGRRPEHGNMIGNGFGIGRSDPYIDQGEAARSWVKQMIRGHLWNATGSRPTNITLGIDDHIARHDQSGISPLLLLYLRFSSGIKLIHINLVIGK